MSIVGETVGGFTSLFLNLRNLVLIHDKGHPRKRNNRHTSGTTDTHKELMKHKKIWKVPSATSRLNVIMNK